MKALLQFRLSYFLFLIPHFLFLISYSQNVGIGTTTPNASALLDISSTTKGLLIPRMSNTQMNAIASPAAGLMVFNTTDSLFYVRKNSGWTKLVPTASGSSWAANGNDIYNSNTGNIGIGTSTPAHARMEINGSVGAAVAIFGADKYGVAIEADNPEVGFNYFYNNGAKTIKAGYASVVGMAPGTGEFYIGNYNGNQSSSNFGNITGYRQNITLFQSGEFRIAGSNNFTHFYYGGNEDTYIRGGKDGSNVILNDITGGKVGIGMNNPTRAVLEQNGSIGTTAAIFGGDGAGISLQKNWPVIGFNHYYDGATHRSIGQGYSGVFGINQNNGNLYYGGWNYAAVPNSSLASYTSRFNVTKAGSVGIGTESPESDLHIIQSNAVDGEINLADGITLDAYYGSFGGSTKWNIQTYSGGLPNASPSEWLAFSRYNSLFAPWSTVSAFNYLDGSYYSLSDVNAKKDIERLNKPNMLSLLLRLNPSQYHFKESKEESPKSFGFISQEVEKIFPNLVAEVNKKKLLNYSGFAPIIVAAIQEQQLQIEELKNEIAELKKIILAKK